MHRRSILLSLVVLLSFSALAAADSLTVNMTLLYTGSNSSGGFYTYPYYFSINGGQATPLMCDSFNNHVSIGESWTAHETGLLSGKGLFGKATLDYKAAGIIFLGIVKGTISPTLGNWAVWNIFSPGVTTDPSVLAIELAALSQAKHTSGSYFKGLALYTAVGSSPGHGPQEYIGYRTPMATAEPGSMMLLGTGLLGLAAVVRRKLLRA